jgi:hypothetical protein
LVQQLIGEELVLSFVEHEKRLCEDVRAFRRLVKLRWLPCEDG